MCSRVFKAMSVKGLVPCLAHGAMNFVAFLLPCLDTYLINSANVPILNHVIVRLRKLSFHTMKCVMRVAVLAGR